MPNLKNITRAVFAIGGIALICLAVIISNIDYTQILLGQDTKYLSWGPTLFRILLIFHGILLIVIALFWKELVARPAIPEIRNESPHIKFAEIAVLLILTGLALILRLWNLNSDLWIDEVLTLLDFARQPFGEILTSFPSQNQHMLYSVLAHSSIEIFGESAWALRLPSVMFGLGSIWALFFLSRKLFGTLEAILGCALMTVSYHHVWFSQNARGYVGLLFFTLIATWCWFEALEKNKWRWWLGYSAAIVLGMWIHMTMAFVVVSQGVLYLILLLFPKLSGNKNNVSLERRASFKPFAAWILSATVTLQLYALALPEFLRIGLHEESKNSEWTNPLWVLTESLKSLSIGFAGITIVLCGAAFVAFGWLVLFKENRRAAILMVLPPILAGTSMIALSHNLFPRFFFFAMGFGILIVVHGAVELPKFIAALITKNEKESLLQNGKYNLQTQLITKYAGVGLILLIIAASFITVPRNYAFPKQNFSGAKEYVESKRMPKDEVVAVGLADVIYGKYLTPHWFVAKSGAELEKLQQNDGEVWLVYTLSPELKAFHPDIWQIIERDYQIVRVFSGTLNGGEVFVCLRRNSIEEKNESSRNFDQR